MALKNGREYAVQFRPEELDLDTFRTARKALGEVVPEAGVLEDDELKEHGIHAYWMTRIPGRIWLRGVAGKGDAGRVSICKSLGQVFSEGFLDPASSPGLSSEEAVDKTIRPHLEAILASELTKLDPFKNAIQILLDKLDDIKSLPLWIAHFDINEVNVLVDDNCHVTGIIDWELSRPLPFGVGFGRIHTIAGEFNEGKFYMPACFVEAEKAFWHAVLGGMGAERRELLEGMADVVQLAVLVGTVCSTVSLEGGKLCIHEVSLGSLEKFLSYRVPMVRGEDEPPYTK